MRDVETFRFADGDVAAADILAPPVRLVGGWRSNDADPLDDGASADNDGLLRNGRHRHWRGAFRRP